MKSDASFKKRKFSLLWGRDTECRKIFRNIRNYPMTKVRNIPECSWVVLCRTALQLSVSA